jgi:hypothetical protein
MGVSTVELMNFVGLAALLSAVGMYGISRWVRHSKTAEAVGSVSTLAGAAAAYFDASDASQPSGTDPVAARATRHFPPSSRVSVPDDPLSTRGKRYQSSQADWAVTPWRELRFSIPQPQYYSYSFKSEGAGAQAKANAIAHGDLDADGHTSTFSATVAPDDSLSAKVSANLERIDADE